MIMQSIKFACMSLGKLLLLAKYILLLLFYTSFLKAVDPTIVIHWSTVTTNGDPELLKDRNGNPLSIGNGGNGTGHVVTLGYFSQANNDSIENHFSGIWTPLTEGTRVGDSSTGYGFSDGMFSFTTVFTRSSNLVTVFPFEPATYNVQTPFTITGEEPEPGTPLCIRFYDDIEVGPAARYNTVTGQNWLWPTFKGGIPENYYFKIASGSPPSGSDWEYGSFFEDPDNNFTTSLELQSYLTVNISGHGSVDSLDPSYNYGSNVAISATPDPNMEFVGWLGDGVAQPSFAQTTVLMDQDRNITAVFEPRDFNVYINQQGKGTTSGAGQHEYNSTINISATPATGYEFSHWEGFGPDSNVSENTTLTIQQDHALVAVFLPLEYNITTSSSTGGTVSIVEDSPFLFDQNYTLFAEPDFGYEFSHWSSDTGSLGLLHSQSNPLTSFLIQGHASYKANFTLTSFYLQVLMNTGGASVLPSSGNQSMLDMVTVTAIPQEGYDFATWTDSSGILINAGLSVTEANMSKANGPVTITANFSKKTYPVTITEGTGGNISLSPTNGPWEHHGVYELNATAQTGYTFSEWQGETNSTSALLFGTETASNKIGVSGPITLHAVFAENEYSIAVSEVGGGVTVGEGNYSILESPVITATPDSGWYFSHWEGDVDYLVAPNSSTSLINLNTAPLSLSFNAVFSREIYSLSISIDGEGTVNGNDSNFSLAPDSGTQVDLSAVPSTGWEFNRWYGMSLSDPTSSSLSFIPSSSNDLTASFEKSSYQVTVTHTSGGEANGSGTYLYDSQLSIEAIPASGYKFDGWSGNTELIAATQSAVDFNIPAENVNLHAEFSPISLSVSTAVVGNGSVSPGGTYNMFSTISLEATPDGIDGSAPRGYQLEKWIWTYPSGGSFNSTDNPLNLFIDANLSVSAVFSAIPPDLVSIDLVSSPSNGGTLFDDPEQRVWNVSADLFERRLSATENPGFSFLGWSSSAPLTFSPTWKSHTITLTPQSESTITSHFAPITHKVLATFDSSKGTVTGTGNDLPTNSGNSLLAQPSENQTFYSWSINRTIDYVVTRANSSVNSVGSSLFIDNKESPTLTLLRGFTYDFQTDLSGNENFYLGTSKNTTSANAYVNGVIDTQSSNGIFSFTVPNDCPDELFYCGSSILSSGGKINVLTRSDEDILPFPNDPEIQPVLNFDLSLHATFVGQELTINIPTSVGGSATGINDGDIFAYGDSITISAVPDEHYEFDRWEFSESIEVSDTEPNLQFNILDSLSIRPLFKPLTYTLELITSPAESGNAFATNNLYTYPYGSVVPIEVVALPGNRFEFWSGSVEDAFATNTNVTIEGNTTIIAQFSETLINITKEVQAFDPDGNRIQESAGVITGGDSFALGAIARFKAEPNEGFEFKRWENEDGDIISSSATSNIQISGFEKLLAIFQKLTHEVQVIASPSGKGEVEWNGRGAGEVISGKIVHGESISLEAFPIPGYTFEKWTSSSGELYKAGQMTLELPVTQSMIVNARFIPINPVELTINTVPENSGWTFGQGIVNQSAKYPILAKPNPGYIFDRWEGDLISDPNSANTSLNLNQDKEITAHFVLDPNYDDSEFPVIDQLGIHHLRVTTANILHGSVSGSGIFGTGWTEIKAYPQQGYEFIRWQGASVEDENALSTLHFLTKDIQIEAVFEKEPAISGAEKIGSNWMQSDWFGTFWSVDQTWLYHTKLGWIHIPESSQSDESMWIWIEKLGAWCWSGKSIFPYFFLYHESKWTWVDLDRSNHTQLIIYVFEGDLNNGVWTVQ